ncbi:S46 family peptidase [Halosquirtibacter xylanolyticus]|uniref:S46 family peptidase n=1 Tax=Halosquirtibacter xylanolyticus TaxID=3374599 RepID=UPI003747E3F7|nr:S46 family peptidase [Prolixibacteraceae bacterium]
MKRTLITLFLAVTVSFNLLADEGMWLPSLIHKLNIKDMQADGLQLTAEDIYSINKSSLKDAIVALDHGSCTGELISNEGLLLTNHHCGFGEIQAHSSVEHDYLKDGFWALKKEDELPNPSKSVSFLVRIEDVTSKVLEGVNEKMTESERQKAISKVGNDLITAAIKDTHYEAKVKNMFDGNKYLLFVYETFRDVRLVGAPPESIGKFGGDTDNWMWPRHTGDFSMFRIYCAPDGTPADYSKENVPLKPRHFLPISLKGVEKDDYAMVMGYPGSTDRFKTSWGVENTMEVTNSIRVKVRTEKLRILKDYMNTSQKAKIQYASKYARSSNYWKNSIGQNKGLKKLHVVEDKQEIENAFAKWVAASSERKAEYGNALSLIANSYKNNSAQIAQSYFIEGLIRGPEVLGYAYGFTRLEDALAKDDKEKIKKNVARIQKSIDDYFKDYDAATDAKLLASLGYIVKENVDAKYLPEELDVKSKKDLEKRVNKYFKKSMFGNKAKLEAFLENPSQKQLEKDPLYTLSRDVISQYRELAKQQKESVDERTKGRRLFVKGLLEMNPDKKYYPNANSTMRVTYGTVKGYDPADGVHYEYFTTLKGYIEKYDPKNPEFQTPQRLIDLYNAKDFGQYADKDGTVHTCFISDNDITGGNSGSPVINGKGELIGAAFDGNWEAMSGDIAFEHKLQRCICVDIRFVLWVVDKYAGATNLINEMTLVK